MNHTTAIGELFKQKPKNVLNIFFTAGYPFLESTSTILNAVQQHGADMVEIGMPYSDPLADGEIIQNSSIKAIENGMNIACLFDQLQQIKNEMHIPMILMGYLNPVLQYGFEQFCKDAAAVNISGLIIPDIPPHEFEHTYSDIIKCYGLDFIFLITPETSNERILYLDRLSSGFLYAVSSSSVTGGTPDKTKQIDFLKRLQNLPLINPVMTGFGIKDKNSFESVQPFCNGAIIGSAFIQVLGNNNGQTIEEKTAGFLKDILNEKLS